MSATTIRLRRGSKENLPQNPALGEPLVATDTKQLFVGTNNGPKEITPVVFVSNYNDLPAEGLESKIYVVDSDEENDGQTTIYRYYGEDYVLISGKALTNLIDDDAGEGDEDKTWSADKLHSEVSDLNDRIDDKVQKDGDTMTGRLTLSDDPESDMHAVTKQYLDSGLDEKVDKDGDTMTGFLTLHQDPEQDMHAANKGYVDAYLQGLDVKESVKAATIENIGLSGLPEVDGVQLEDGDRVLVKEQNDASENGLYVASGSDWVRAEDADNNDKVNPGMFAFVEEGDTYANQGFVLTTNDPIDLGTTGLSFSRFSGAGQITAGDALGKDGNRLDVKVDDSTIEVDGDELKIKDDSVGTQQLAGDIDATGIGFDAAKVGGKEVYDDGTGDGYLWTAEKIQHELDNVDVSAQLDEKADKVEGDVEGKLPKLDNEGNLKDSGIAANRVIKDPENSEAGDLLVHDGGKFDRLAAGAQGTFLQTGEGNSLLWTDTIDGGSFD